MVEIPGVNGIATAKMVDDLANLAVNELMEDRSIR